MNVESEFKNTLFLKRHFLFILLILFFPPLPVALNTFVFKFQGIIISLLFCFSLFVGLYKGVLKKMNMLFLIMFLIPSLWGLIIGLIYGNPLYNMFKDFYFFIVPLLVYFLLKNFFKKVDDVRESIVYFALFVSILQVVLSIHGIIFWHGRLVFRHTSFLISTSIIPLALILNVVKDLKFFKIKNLLFILALLSTLSRLFFLFVIVLYCSFLFFKVVKSTTSRFAYLLTLFFVSVISYSLPLFLHSVNIIDNIDKSVGWRYIEWISYFQNLKDFNFSQVFLGNGFGSFLKTIKHLRLFSGITLYQIDRFHNLYLFLVFKLGIVGIFFVMLFLFYVFKKMLLFDNKEGFFLRFALLFLVLLAGLVGGLFTSSLTAGVIVGMLLYLNEEFDKSMVLLDDR